ncbi:hypothetical protein CR513_30445, partial [Mucuna pruriens]
MGCVLGQHELGRKENVIYYLRKKFTDYEMRYSPLGCTCCALAWAARSLFPLFTARLGFNYMNNMEEYKARTIGFAMALEYRAKMLKVYGDSALVTHQL